MIIGQLLSLVLGFSLLAAFGITTDQIMQNVYDSTNTALRTNLVAGGGGGAVGPGTTNTVAKFTAATTIGDSGITDNGTGGIGVYPASATPQATTWTFASGTGTDIAGANEIIKLSGSTGAGLGGNIAFQNTNKAGAGTTANTYGNVLTLSPPNTGTTAPVNYVDIKNAITGSGPTISVAGTDTNTNLILAPKGTGMVVVPNGTSAQPGIAFSSDADASASGFYRFGTNIIAVDLNGTPIMAWFDGGRIDVAGTLQLKGGINVGSGVVLGYSADNLLQIGVTTVAPPANSIQGTATNTNGNAGGAITIKGGPGLTTGAGGAATIQGGTSGTGGISGATTIGGATSAGTDITGGLTTIQGGIATGAAVPGPIKMQTGNVLGTGSTAQTLVDRYDVGVQKVLANNTVTPAVNFTMANNTVVAGNATYSCQVFNGTDLQIEEGEITFHATNKNNTPANNTVVKYGNQQAMTSGTLTVTWTITAANPAVLSVNCNSSLTPSTGYPILTYAFHNLTGQAAAIQ